MTGLTDLMDDTYRQMRGEVALNADNDPFAWVQGWRFAICEVLLFDWGYCVPEFRTMAHEPEEDSYEVEILRTFYEFEDGGESIPMKYWHVEETLKTLLAVLDRYRVWVGLAGKDY